MHVLALIGLGVLGVLAGSSAVVQQVLVANLRTALGSPFWAVFISYVGGTLTMAVVLLMAREPLWSTAAAAKSSIVSWAGGVFGVMYIATAIMLIPRLGSATVLALLIAGQLLTSIVFDHFGLFGLARQPADLGRLAGAAMLIGGVLLIQR